MFGIMSTNFYLTYYIFYVIFKLHPKIDITVYSPSGDAAFLGLVVEYSEDINFRNS